MAEGRVLPEGRYGTRTARPPRTARWLLPLLGVVVGLAVAVAGYRNLASPPINAERLGFELLSPDTIRIEFEVLRDDPGQPAVCIVRARSADGTESGRREVYIPPADTGSDRAVHSAEVRTSRPPVAADVYGCSLDVPAYLRPGSNS